MGCWVHEVNSYPNLKTCLRLFIFAFYTSRHSPHFRPLAGKNWKVSPFFLNWKRNTPAIFLHLLSLFKCVFIHFLLSNLIDSPHPFQFEIFRIPPSSIRTKIWGRKWRILLIWRRWAQSSNAPYGIPSACISISSSSSSFLKGLFDFIHTSIWWNMYIHLFVFYFYFI